MLWWFYNFRLSQHALPNACCTMVYIALSCVMSLYPYNDLLVVLRPE